MSAARTIFAALIPVAVACGGFAGPHPSPADYGVSLGIPVDDLFVETGYEDTDLASHAIEAGMLKAANDWYRKTTPPRRYFAAAVQFADWKITRSRGEPKDRRLCSMFYWLDEQDLCHGSALEFKQDFDGTGYSDRFQYADWCILSADTPVRAFDRPNVLVDGDSSEAVHASQGRGNGLLFEACSDPDAFARHLAEHGG